MKLPLNPLKEVKFRFNNNDNASIVVPRRTYATPYDNYPYQQLLTANVAAVKSAHATAANC